VHKALKFRTTKEAVDETRFAPHPFHGVAQFMPQTWEIEAAQMAQLNPFELLPEALIRVQLRRIGRQAFQVAAVRRALGQELLDGVAVVDRRAIPDEEHPTRHLPQQVLEKRDHVIRVEGVVLAMEVELARGRDGADGGEMVASAALPQDGGLAHGRIGAHDPGQGIEASFIDEEDGLPMGLRPLLRAGQISSRHWAIAASSRCRARRIGFWGLQRRAFRRRPTWVGW
jgi:hypothetical protein